MKQDEEQKRKRTGDERLFASTSVSNYLQIRYTCLIYTEKTPHYLRLISYTELDIMLSSHKYTYLYSYWYLGRLQV